MEARSQNENRYNVTVHGVDVLNWESEVKKLDLRKKYPNATHPMHADKATDGIAKKKLLVDVENLDKKIKADKKILREKGSIDQQIRDKTAKRQEAERLSKLTETEALDLYDRTNGYFHFDKGHQESEDYTKSRPRMNSEIHKYNARQAIEDLEKQHGTNTIKALQDLAHKHYKRNLLYNLETLVDKAAGTLK